MAHDLGQKGLLYLIFSRPMPRSRTITTSIHAQTQSHLILQTNPQNSPNPANNAVTANGTLNSKSSTSILDPPACATLSLTHLITRSYGTMRIPVWLSTADDPNSAIPTRIASGLLKSPIARPVMNPVMEPSVSLRTLDGVRKAWSCGRAEAPGTVLEALPDVDAAEGGASQSRGGREVVKGEKA
ncbi:MAG: hypothetical protein M1831_006715 [Alyxoria varia]|nr:MAG: hypothetical protein M1831_006715 [Alyxoria varia]